MKKYIQNFFKKSLVNFLWNILGRKKFALFSRFLWMKSRLDMPNDWHLNGEIILHNALFNVNNNHNTKIIFDIGANIGQWSNFFLKNANLNGFDNFILHVFEPSPDSFTLLKTNLLKNHNKCDIYFEPYAVSNIDGKTYFSIISPTSQINSLSAIDKSKVERIIEVQCTSIEKYCQKQSINQIYFIKIDTEGNDFNVIQGAKSLFAEGRISFIQFEYNHRWIAFRCFLKDVFDFLQPYHYKIGKITPKGIEFYRQWHPELEKYVEGNYLICKDSLSTKLPAVKWWNE